MGRVKTFSFEQHTSYMHVMNMTVMTSFCQLHNVPHENTKRKRSQKVLPFHGTEIIVTPPKHGSRAVSSLSTMKTLKTWDNRP